VVPNKLQFGNTQRSTAPVKRCMIENKPTVSCQRPGYSVQKQLEFSAAQNSIISFFKQLKLTRLY